MNVYVELTRAFNGKSFSAILSSGQAVVMHRLAIMSKDGDWILREEPGVMNDILTVLDSNKARYRFGAPLDCRWMQGGWSSHFEFQRDALRVRTDFVTRPPRIPFRTIQDMWLNPDYGDIPFVDAGNLAELKKTNREKDYAVIGELARMLKDPKEALLLSRSGRDIMAIADDQPELVAELTLIRPVLGEANKGREKLEAALDAERRQLMHANEERLHRYMKASEDWFASWSRVAERIKDLPLLEAHEIVVSEAEGLLPFNPLECNA